MYTRMFYRNKRFFLLCHWKQKHLWVSTSTTNICATSSSHPQPPLLNTEKRHSHKLTGQLTVFHHWEGVIRRNCQILITLNISLQGSKTSWDHFWTRFIDDHFESLAMVVVATINLSFSVTVVWNVLLIEAVALAKYGDNGCGSWLVVITVVKLAQDECDLTEVEIYFLSVVNVRVAAVAIRYRHTQCHS